MISVHSMKRPMIGGQPYAFEFKGLSTDTKPSVWGGNDVGVNSLFFEQDTGDFYYLKQQGSESKETITLVQETEINDYGEGWDQVRNTKYFDNPKVTVKWDGIAYECPRFSDGGQHYAGYGDPSFTEYPFYLFFQLDQGDNSILDVMFARGQASHNVEVYTEETVVVPTEWEKIGGSGGEGDEMKIKVVVTVVNPTENDIAISGTYELKDGMFIGGVRHMIKAGESEVIEYYAIGHTNYDSFYDGTGEAVSYYLNNGVTGTDAHNTHYYGADSNLVNVNEDEEIIDPTKPASFTTTLTVD